jgi:hypothetical protein
LEVVRVSGRSRKADASEPSSEGELPAAATLFAYRVFGCNGSVDSDIMIAAMERAFADGAQIVNMSIGAVLVTFPEYPTALVAHSLVDRGVVVVT